MDVSLGFKTNTYAMVMADATVAHSIILVKDTEDKVTALDSHKLLACTGDIADALEFSKYLQKNMKLYNLRNGIDLDTEGAANYIRTELATALRQHPYQVDLILVGYDEASGPSLYFIDYLASMAKINYAAQGYANYFCTSILDEAYRPDLTEEEGIRLMKKCIQELKTRFMIQYPKFVCKIVDKNGIRLVSLDVAGYCAPPVVVVTGV